MYVCMYVIPGLVGGHRQAEALGRWGHRKGGMIRLEIELELTNSSFSSLTSRVRASRAFPLSEIRQAAPCRAIRGKSSDSRQQYLGQQYPPPLVGQEGQPVDPRRLRRGPRGLVQV